MFYIALTFGVSGRDYRKPMFLTQPVTDPPNLMVAAFVGMVMLVVLKADRAENQMIMNMVTINMGGQNIFVLSF